MPKIYLKPNSAEFQDETQNIITQCCEMPGCAAEGAHKAPKSRYSLNEYYWFCLEHVQEYNKAWNYFSGMTPQEMEEHVIRSALWDRPTHRYDPAQTEALHRKAYQTYHFTADDPPPQKDTYRHTVIDPHSPEFQAITILGLEPPLDLQKIKARYKDLAKKYHPDLNQGDKQCEELLKSVNMAYTILKLAYEKYDKLENPNENSET